MTEYMLDKSDPIVAMRLLKKEIKKEMECLQNNLKLCKESCGEWADENERLQAENDVTKTAIATIAGQKLFKEMQNPEDGDYQYAYEEMIMVARRASDALKEQT